MKCSRNSVRCTIVGLMLMTFLIAFPAVPAVQVYAATSDNVHITAEVVTRAEQTVWKYRTVNNKLQKRLWSITYGKWLTDWEWV